MRKFISLCLIFLLIFTLGACKPKDKDSASDSDNSSPSTADSTDSVDSSSENSPWTEEPTVKSTFYTAFGNDERIGDSWALVNYGWGKNMVTASNVGYTRSPAVVRGMGATGGVIVLNSYGDLYADASKRWQGGVMISKRLFGPGKYEVRMRIVPRFGPCSTAWSYYTNSYAITNAAGSLVYGHSTPDEIQYHEIDIECPQRGNGFNGWGGVAYEEYYQNADDLQANGEGRVVNRSTGVGCPTGSPYNDGMWHTFAFEWRTEGYDYDASAGENPGAVIWYMDGKEVGRTAKNTPYYPDQLWIGNWFPANSEDWLGIADFDIAYMYIDWVRITEYDDEYLTVGKDGKEIKPDLNGCYTFSTDTNTNYGANIPINNYISNNNFGVGSADSPSGWTLRNGARVDGKLVLRDNGRATQTISAQYGGYEFVLEAKGSVAEGSGKIYVEYIAGEYEERSNSNNKMTETVVGRSEELDVGDGRLEFRLPENLGVNNFRIVIEAGDGSVVEMTNIDLWLKSDLAFAGGK